MYVCMYLPLTPLQKKILSSSLKTSSRKNADAPIYPYMHMHTLTSIFITSKTRLKIYIHYNTKIWMVR